MAKESILQKRDENLSSIAGLARSELEKVHKDGRSLTMLVSQDNEQHELVLPSDVVTMLMDILEHLSLHKAVSIVASDKMLTTQQVADILHVSRPFITKLIDAGELKCERVGTHRRVKYEDVLAYKSAMDEKRRQALDELTKEAQELEI